MAVNEIKIIRVLLEQGDETGLTFRQIRDFSYIYHKDDLQKSLSFLIGTNIIKRIKKEKCYRYFLISRACPLVMKLKEELRNQND
jgi:hypothetical protein